MQVEAEGGDLVAVDDDLRLRLIDLDAVILIFLVLAAQFNSFRDPLIILLGSVPLAMFGRCCSPS